MKFLLAVSLLILQFNVAYSLTDEEKEEILQTIYKDLVKAGTNKKPAPKLVFMPNLKSKMASYGLDDDGNDVITFEGPAFDVCESLGGEDFKMAIAYILGHELMHFYKDHQWSNKFRSAFSINDLELEIAESNAENIKNQETQADALGGLLCYMAGYNTKGIAVKLLPRLSEVYNAVKPDRLSHRFEYIVYAKAGTDPKKVKVSHNGATYGVGDRIKPEKNEKVYEIISGEPLVLKVSKLYPTLDQRIEIARTQDSVVQIYIRMFEAGNYALLTDEYAYAISCYDYIVKNEFESREIFNNLGVAYFLHGAKLAGQDAMKYIYPVELDLQTKLTQKGSGSKGMGEEELEKFELAAKYFASAIECDNKYAPAFNNLACAQLVLEEMDMVFANIVMAKSLAKKEAKNNPIYNNTLQNARLMEALYLQITEEEEEAMELLTELEEECHYLSILNKKLIENVDFTELKNTPIACMQGDATQKKVKTGTVNLEGVEHSNISSILENQKNIINDGGVEFNERDHVLFIDFETSTAYFIKKDLGMNDYLFYHVTNSNYEGTVTVETMDGNKEFKLGDSPEKIAGIFGAPGKATATRQGTMYYYDDAKVLFLFNAGKLDSIVTFTKSFDLF